MTIKERVQEVFNKFNVNLTAEEVLRVDMAEAALENGTVIYTDGEDFAEGEEAYIINDEGERIPLPPGDYTLADGGVISIGDLGKVNKVTKPAGGDAKNEGKPDAKGIDGKPNIDSTKPTKPKNQPAQDAPAKPPAKTPPPKQDPKKKLASEEEETTTMNVELNQEEVLAVLNERFPDLGEELAQAIAAAVAEVYAQPEEEVVEEEAKEEEKEEMTETTETEATEEVEVEVEVEMSEQKPEKTELESLKEALEATNAKLEELQKFAAEPGLKHKAPAKKVEKLDLANMTIEERVRALANQLSK
jgi:hypothetical protein